MKPASPTRAILYARFSPRPNSSECESCEVQLERLRAWCLAIGYDVAAEYRDEDASGKSTDNRPGLEAALAHVCTIKGVLCIYSLSRLARKALDAHHIAERLRKARAQLSSLQERFDTTTSMGRVVYGILAVFAEWERDQISERTRDSMRRHQSNGRRMSNLCPYGWTRDPADPKRLVEDPAEQAVIQRIREWHHLGMGLRAMASRLRANGTPTRGINNWTHTQISRILKRERLI